MCTNTPFLNKAIEGDDGGKGNIFSRAVFTASLSTPATTVTTLDGFLLFSKLRIAPGRALSAAQPQTGFTNTKVVASLDRAFSTSSVVCNDSNTADANYASIGVTISSGYIMNSTKIYLQIYKK